MAACSGKGYDEIELGKILDMSDDMPNGLVLGQRWDIASDKPNFVQAKMQELNDTTGRHVGTITVYLFEIDEKRDKDFEELSSILLKRGKSSEIPLPTDIGEQVIAVSTDQVVTILFAQCHTIAEIAFNRTHEDYFGLNEFSMLAQKLDQRIISSVCP